MEVVAHTWIAQQETMALPEGLQVEVRADGWVWVGESAARVFAWSD
jgi:hypothetical protein